MSRRIVLGSAALVLCGSAAAHTGTGLAGGFAPGFAHPFTGFDHLLAMVAVGLWGAFLGPPLLQVLPVVFPGMMVGGAILAMLGVPVPPVEIGIAVSVLVLGVCIALRFESPVWLATAIVACFGIFHGYAHGKELPSAADPIGYSAGFVLATGLLHVTGIGLGCWSDRPGGAALIRGVGGIIGALGVWFSYAAIMS
ncbi:MAG: HupE/UreJ family protein [Proteobacteria bacterium]|nr:HupE/UreJ family protein [Pseudomonadota bacterium]